MNEVINDRSEFGIQAVEWYFKYISETDPEVDILWSTLRGIAEMVTNGETGIIINNR